MRKIAASRNYRLIKEAATWEPYDLPSGSIEELTSRHAELDKTINKIEHLLQHMEGEIKVIYDYLQENRRREMQRHNEILEAIER
jgi:uncharacterized beta-barrel protein YwiB (DUF1934 family)